jgi:hypothetical protein
LLLNSGIRLQWWHHPAAVVADPGLFQELRGVTALLPEGGGDHGRRLRQTAPLADWTPWLILR